MVMLPVIEREARKCIGPASALRRVQLAHALTLIECDDLSFGFLQGFPWCLVTLLLEFPENGCSI